jgi:predicted phosphodiesterase
MRIFAISDIHIDHPANAKWLAGLSLVDYRNDLLVLAGDVAHSSSLLQWAFSILGARFRTVLFVPGNHDLWVIDEDKRRTSLEKFEDVRRIAQLNGVYVEQFSCDTLSILPLFGWYDYSFGEPSAELRLNWMDFYACRWPTYIGPVQVASYFASLNASHFERAEPAIDCKKIITFSHFLPRIDLIPSGASRYVRELYPVLGSALIEKQLRFLKSNIHVYGHSHLNRSVVLDGVLYINNAFGYPYETRIASKRLLCIHEE